MPVRRNPIQVLKEAKQIASDHGCFVFEGAEKGKAFYVVYRKLPDRNERLGRRNTPGGLRSLVCRVTNFK